MLLVIFALSRVVGAWLADNPEVYAPSTFGAVTGDVIIYEGWAITLLGNNIAAYSGIGIEYPPAALPFLTVPHVFHDRLRDDAVQELPGAIGVRGPDDVHRKPERAVDGHEVHVERRLRRRLRQQAMSEEH